LNRRRHVTIRCRPEPGPHAEPAGVGHIQGVLDGGEDRGGIGEVVDWERETADGQWRRRLSHVEHRDGAVQQGVEPRAGRLQPADRPTECAVRRHHGLARLREVDGEDGRSDGEVRDRAAGDHVGRRARQAI
jgi:hypothetical protein